MPHKRKQLNFSEPDMWYVIGLITADGCLYSKKKTINITAKDMAYLETLKSALGLENRIGAKKNGRGATHYQIQFTNRNFYDFLLSIGLTPAKSKTLEGLEISDLWFRDFVRGVIDGDGCITTWVHSTNKRCQWSMKIYSAAPVFARWIKNAIETYFHVKGRIHQAKTGVFNIKFGKMAAQRVLEECYYERCLSLDRKANLAKLCRSSDTGWTKSKTVLCAA